MDAGFSNDDLGVVAPGTAETGEPVATGGLGEDQTNRGLEGAVTGGVVGGGLGAILAASGALVIPGIGPLITGGMLIALLGGAAGWLVGGLVGMGVSEEEASYYEAQVESGRTLLAVRADGRVAEVRQILLQFGGEVRIGTDDAIDLLYYEPKDQAYDRAEKEPMAPPGNLHAEPASANPVLLSPTDPHRDTPEGQPYLDDANPYGRSIPNEQGRPMGGVGVIPKADDPALETPPEQPGQDGAHPLPQALQPESQPSSRA
jgi:hypothetical protein